MFTIIVFLLSKLDCNWRLRNSSYSSFNLDFQEFRNCSSNHYVFYSYSFPQISKNSSFVMPLTFASEMICCNNSFDFSESSFVTANSFRTLAPLLRSAKIQPSCLSRLQAVLPAIVFHRKSPARSGFGSADKLGFLTSH